MYEWDPSKAQRNLKKHGIAFDEAATAFDDLRGLSGRDLQHSDVELRYRWIGRARSGLVLTVIYTLRRTRDGETAIRLVSARRASRKERKAYAAD